MAARNRSGEGVARNDALGRRPRRPVPSRMSSVESGASIGVRHRLSPRRRGAGQVSARESLIGSLLRASEALRDAHRAAVEAGHAELAKDLSLHGWAMARMLARTAREQLATEDSN